MTTTTRTNKGDCDCPDFEKGISSINAQTVFCSVHSAGPTYTGAMFNYCPWCGQNLPDVEEAPQARVKCHACKKPIHVTKFAGIRRDTDGEPQFFCTKPKCIKQLGKSAIRRDDLDEIIEFAYATGELDS